MTTKVETDSEPPIFIEPKAVNEPEPNIIDEAELEVEEPLMGTLVELSVEPTIELVPSSPVVRDLLPLRSPDVYDPLQNLLEATSSQEFGFLMVQRSSLQWGRFASACCMCFVRSTIDCSRLVTEVSFISTILVQP